MLLHIDDLRLRVCLGYTDQERAYPQQVGLDLRLELDGAECISKDELSYTVDYVRVQAVLTEFLGTRSWKLIETLSFDIASELLRSFDCLDAVTVKITKAVLPEARGVCAELRLQRDA